MVSETVYIQTDACTPAEIDIYCFTARVFSTLEQYTYTFVSRQSVPHRIIVCPLDATDSLRHHTRLSRLFAQFVFLHRPLRAPYEFAQL